MSLRLGTDTIAGSTIQLGQPLNIGQIIESIVPLTDAGLHLLDGALINGSGIYSAFVDAIADLVTDYPDLFETEANWQSAVTTYGVCGKFVYDDVNNTVRLPKITGILEGTTDATALGDLVEVGLPNITGNHANVYNSDYKSGCFDNSYYGSGAKAATVGSNYGMLVFDASLSSSIYGNSNTVQPQTIKCYYYIVIATATKTEIEVDIDDVVTDLNGKADVDFTNCDYTPVKPDMSNSTMPYLKTTYINGASGYRIWSDGYCEQWGAVMYGSNQGYKSWSITLLKTFADTNYNIDVTVSWTATTDYGTAYFSNKGVSSFTMYTCGYGGLWKASGYLASGQY